MDYAGGKPTEGRLVLSSEDRDIDSLILDGAIEVSGIDSDTGDFLYSFTEKLKEIDPDLYDNIYEFFYSGVMSLWEKGIVEMDLTEDDPGVTIYPEKITDEFINSLSTSEKAVVSSILRYIESE